VKQVKASSGARVGGGGGGGGGGYDSYDRPARAPRAAAAPKGAPIPDRIFVGNVPRELSNAKLAETFAVCGKVLLASMAGAKGFGYVTFETPAGAAAAVARFNGKDIGGRPARVELATTPDNGLRK
jgi:RNA recognition motif-containing protein